MRREREAIMELDGGLSRADAATMAGVDIRLILMTRKSAKIEAEEMARKAVLRPIPRQESLPGFELQGYQGG